MTEPDGRRHASYATIAESTDFRELRRRYRGFAFPATIAFMTWYLLFVVCANWLPAFMGAQLVGDLNVALIFGLLQFASTFVIAWLYARHANRKLDPIADRLSARFQAEHSQDGPHEGGARQDDDLEDGRGDQR